MNSHTHKCDRPRCTCGCINGLCVHKLEWHTDSPWLTRSVKRRSSVSTLANARATKFNVNGKGSQMYWKSLDEMTCAYARATNSNVNGAGMQNVIENSTYSDAVDAPLTLLLLYIRNLFYLREATSTVRQRRQNMLCFLTLCAFWPR